MPYPKVKSLKIYGQSAGEHLSTLLEVYGAVSETGKVSVSDEGRPTLSWLKVQSSALRNSGVVSMDYRIKLV